MNDVVVFTGGGTGGHVFPGLAVVEELIRRWDGKAVWIGSHAGVEKKILADWNLPYYGITAGKLRRYFSLQNFVDVFKVLLGTAQAVLLLHRLAPAAVFSKGGYVSVPVVFAAAFLGIPVITHESDYDPGLATRLNAKLARRVLVAYPDTVQFFPAGLRSRVLVTGNPVRRAVRSGDRDRGRRALGLDADRSMVLFLGGSLGAQQINLVVWEIRERLLTRCDIIHQTGEAGQNEATEIADGRSTDSAGSPVGRYITRDFFGAEYPDILAAADLVVCRAGAGTLWELATLTRPAVLIPLGEAGSRGDQLRNADVFERTGGVEVIAPDCQSSESVLERITDLLDRPERRAAMSASLAGVARDETAGEIADMLVEIMNSRKGSN